MDEDTVWVVAPFTTIYINDDRIFYAGDVVTPDDFESWTEFRGMIAAGKIIGKVPDEPGPEPDEKWDGFTIDDALSATSVNPVQNRVVNEAINAVSSSLASETAAREAAEKLLTEKLADESKRAEVAETELRNKIETEATTRQEADKAHDDEIAKLHVADNTLSEQIEAETDAREAAVDAINAKIPSAASAENQLADKAFVNSSIGTNTSYFLGTFDSLEELEAYSGDKTNNDYAFVKTTDTAGNTLYNRYKWNADEDEWLLEYTLNNSSFTQAQWDAINSGATQELIARIKDGNGTDAGLLRLSDATNGTQGTDDATAATPSAVKKAYDLASSANETANSVSNMINAEAQQRQAADDALGKRIDDVGASVQSLERRAAEALTDEQHEVIASMLDGTYVEEEDDE